MKTHKAPFKLKEIKIEVTHSCLLKCVHCSSMADELSTRQMSWLQCERILSEASAMGVREIAFSGGEPLLWGKIPGAVRLASQGGMRVSLYSTGNADNASVLLKEMKENGLSRIIFSVYSKSPDKHSQITKVEGSLERTLSAVRHCVDIGLQVEFHFVPMSINYRELRDVVELARGLSVSRVSVLRLVPQGRASNYDELKLKSEENLALRQSMIGLIKEGHDVRIGSPFNILRMRKNPECCAAIDRLTISPDMTISPCDAFKQIPPSILNVSAEYSSLADASLSECWQRSPYLNRVREYLTTPFAKECSDCQSLKACLSGCVAQKIHAYGDLVKRPDPMCLKTDHFQ